MKKIIQIASYIPLIYLVYVYAGHGVEGFFEAEEFYEVIGVLGLGSAITAILAFLVGVLDTYVGVLLVAKDKVLSQLSWFYLYLWVGLWPWVPRAMEWYGGLEMEISDAAIVSVVAVCAYFIHTRYHTRATFM